MKKFSKLLWIAVVLLGWSSTMNANNIRIVSDVTLVGQDTMGKFIFVQFDLAWDNSWRDTCNYDAAWVFIKFSNNNAWKHGYFSIGNAGHGVEVNNGIVPAFSVGKTTVSNGEQGMGVFIYRSANGSGNINWQQVKLKWNYGQNGLTDAQAAAASIKVFAIEMVYVPQLAFNVGSNGSEINSFFSTHSYTLSCSIIGGCWYSDVTTNYFNILNESSIRFNGVYSNRHISAYTCNSCGPASIPNNISWTTVPWPCCYNQTVGDGFPKGFAPFFCMKYEITQEQYLEFVNSLLPQQQISRISATAADKYMSNNGSTTSPQFRNGIRCKLEPTTTTSGYWVCDLNNNAVFNEEMDGQNIACNYISWDDALAFADWAGLRPMTELEYEKACRGPVMLPNEYAWGTNNIDSVLTIANPGLNSEGSGTIGANAVYGNNPNVQGPLRVGAFATGTSTREGSGASFYGIMDLSGNVWEQVVPLVSGSSPSSFNGLHGNGELFSNGGTDMSVWTSGVSSGCRGGAWNTNKQRLRVSDRNNAMSSTAARAENIGFRCVRTAL